MDDFVSFFSDYDVLSSCRNQDDLWNKVGQVCERGFNFDSRVLGNKELDIDDVCLSCGYDISGKEIKDLNDFQKRRFLLENYVVLSQNVSVKKWENDLINRVNNKEFDQWDLLEQSFYLVKFYEAALSQKISPNKNLIFQKLFAKYSSDFSLIDLRKQLVNDFFYEFSILDRQEELRLDEVRSVLDNTLKKEILNVAYNNEISSVITVGLKSKVEKDGVLFFDTESSSIKFNPKNFGNYYIVFGKQKVDEYKKSLGKDWNKTLGCPALFIPSENQKNVFSNIYWWQANHYLGLREAYFGG